MYYMLTKMSTPDSFQIITSSIEVIFDHIFACTACREVPENKEDEECYLSSDFEELPIKEQVYELLSTACGAEYVLDEYNSYEDLIGEEFSSIIKKQLEEKWENEC